MQRHMALTEEQKRSSKSEFFLLLAIQTYVCFFSNGALPSIQTYSCLPFGNTVYHLAVTLSAMANPVMAFAAFFIPCRKVKYIAMLTGIGSIFGGFILATALYSPNMLLGQTFGGFLTVSYYTLSFCYFVNFTSNTSGIQTISTLYTSGDILGCIRSPIFIRKSFCIWTLPTEIYVSIVLVWRGNSSWISTRCITNVCLGQCHIWSVRSVLCGVLIRNEELRTNYQ